MSGINRKISAAYVILFMGFFGGISLYIFSQSPGLKFLKNYSSKDYDHQPQNWGMVQDKNGIIYVANNGGVLEYDGVSWRLIDIPNLVAQSLAIDETGTIYVGGNNEFGHLEPDSAGTLKYRSLRDYLQEKQMDFSKVWGTYVIGKQIYFDTSAFLFRWTPNRKELVGLRRSYHALYSCGGKLYVRREKTGLEQITQIEGDQLKTIPVNGGALFSKVKVFMMTVYNDRNLLIGSRSNGLYLFDGDSVKPFPAKVDRFLKKNGLYHGIRLSSGDFALATRLGGIVIMSSSGDLKHVIDKDYGILDNNVNYVYEDTQGNLWLCLGKGISKIEYSSPFSIYDERSGLYGLVNSSVKHIDTFYAGTTAGIFYLGFTSGFRPLPGISEECWDLLPTGDSLLAATSAGVLVIKQNRLEAQVTGDRTYCLLDSKYYPGRVWCGTGEGLIALIHENGRWKLEHRYNDIQAQIRSIAEDINGNLWLGTLTGSVFLLHYPGSGQPPVNTRYDRSDGLPDSEIHAAAAAGGIIFATQRGLFKFDKETNRFVPDFTLGTEYAGQLDEKKKAKAVFRLVESMDKNIWFVSQSRNHRAIPGPGQTFKIHTRPFLRIPTTAQANSIYPDPGQNATWFATVDGLIRYETTDRKNYKQNFHTLVRHVLINEKPVSEIENLQNGKAIGEQFPILRYSERNIRFEFAAPFFEAENETRYRCLLEGYDNNWSAWSTEANRNYTNLDPGLYKFRVQAENIYRHPGGEATFQFRVLPPWYRTWWAYILYAAALLSVMFSIIKWRAGKLEREKIRLEQVVKERTKEIEEQKQQLEKKTIQLKDQSEKLEEMDKVKSRFFANISHEFRTPLTLIMSPLEQMLTLSRDKKQKTELDTMLRNSQRLLSLINQLLELSRLDSGKVKLQASLQNIVPFLKGAIASFDMLARQNKITLEFNPGTDEILLYFDHRKLEEVMYNLLFNAFKFTPAGGIVTVSVSPVQPTEGEEPRDAIAISVRDSGAGIPNTQLPHIFDRFFQGTGSEETGRKGTGIGLALTKEIVQLHHGRIDVHSQEGKGTEFVILLLLGREHLKPDEIISPADAEPEPRFEKAKEVETLHIETEEETETDGKDSIIDVKNEKRIILVVEDNADVRKYIRGPLEAEYSVVEARDGKEGIDKAKDIIPDLIVSDIMMPEIDGNELCRRLKQDVKTSHIPIILLTAKASEESIIEGLETGADDYITKPFNTSILMTRIKNLIQLRLQLQQKIQKEMLLQPSEIAVSSIDQEFIKELQAVIKKNLKDPGFNVEELSKLMYMNRATLYRKIIALTGDTPVEFIRSYRLKRAAQLLRDNFGNVSQVSLEVGFSNMAYFAKIFKEKFHQLPSTYLASQSK